MKLFNSIIIVLLIILLSGCSKQKLRDIPANQPPQSIVSNSSIQNQKETETETEMEMEYPSSWPNLVISSSEKNIPWIRGDANFTGQINGVIGNTNFGYDERKAKTMIPTQLKPNTIITFEADEVKGLDKPKYNVWLLYNENRFDKFPVVGNKITVPSDEGEYVYSLLVDWGQGDNTISYWFKIKIVK